MRKPSYLLLASALISAPVLAHPGTHSATQQPASASMQGMDHSQMDNMQGMQGMDHSKMMNDPSNPFMPAEMSMHQKMMSAKGANVGETWTRKMIEHHRGAIEMSRIVLAQSSDATVRREAQKSITEQNRSIAELQASLRAKGKRAQ